MSNRSTIAEQYYRICDRFEDVRQLCLGKGLEMRPDVDGTDLTCYMFEDGSTIELGRFGICIVNGDFRNLD